jgi:hypothetical protein
MNPAPPVTKMFLTSFRSLDSSGTLSPMSTRSNSDKVLIRAACFSKSVSTVFFEGDIKNKKKDSTRYSTERYLYWQKKRKKGKKKEKEARLYVNLAI